MKFALLIAAAAVAGALATFAVPPTFVGSATDGLRQMASTSGLAQIHLVDLNPFRAIYDMEKQQIQAGMTPEQLGIHSSAVTISPITLPPPQALKLDLSHAFAEQEASEIQRNNQRMEDLRNYGRDPAHWEGPPPN